jgi:hypothetical protein
MPCSCAMTFKQYFNVCLALAPFSATSSSLYGSYNEEQRKALRTINALYYIVKHASRADGGSDGSLVRPTQPWREFIMGIFDMVGDTASKFLLELYDEHRVQRTDMSHERMWITYKECKKIRYCDVVRIASRILLSMRLHRKRHFLPPPPSPPPSILPPLSPPPPPLSCYRLPVAPSEHRR